MRCLIIDDEALARSRLKRLLLTHRDVVIVGEAGNGVDGLQSITQYEPDLVFLDIEMPMLDGFQMLQAIPAGVPVPLVIFTTGYEEHALAAYEADALAYLLKPVEEDRLNASLVRARRLLSSDSDRQQEVRRLTHAIGQRPSMEQIVGKKKERFFLLRPEEIYFFIAEDGLVKLSTLRETYTVALTLNDLENALATKHFFRVHRSALLNLNRIREIQPYFRSSYIILMGDQLGTEFQVSERQAKHLRELIPGL